MPISNLTEYGSKKLFNNFITANYEGLSFNKTNNFSLLNLCENNNYVIKIDCAIKGRFKKGLMRININKNEIIEFINSVNYDNFIIEPYVENMTIEPFVKKSNEYYISILNNNINLIILTIVLISINL